MVNGEEEEGRRRKYFRVQAAVYHDGAPVMLTDSRARVGLRVSARN